MSRQRVTRELGWLFASGAAAALMTSGFYGWEWPHDAPWVFYAPYAVYTAGPWPLFGALILILVAVRMLVLLVRWRWCRMDEQRGLR